MHSNRTPEFYPPLALTSLPLNLALDAIIGATGHGVSANTDLHQNKNNITQSDANEISNSSCDGIDAEIEAHTLFISFAARC